ncbi:MAG: AbrB/MazE/SpoVT family DNA-binding domain-containing protein [Candidatus Paceibacterota bacterium]
MMHKENMEETFFGMATIGEKGQAVVPAKAREKMNLKKGDKLMVFSFDDDLLIFSKMDGLEKFASHLSDKLKDINDIINKGNK